MAHTPALQHPTEPATTEPMTTDTLFFDLDGTLTDNYAGIAGCIVHALEHMQRPAPPAVELHACIGPPLRQNFSRLLETSDSETIERARALRRARLAGERAVSRNSCNAADDRRSRLSAVRLHVEAAALRRPDHRAL